MSTFPDGVFQYGGEPVGGVRYSSPWATAFFVDGTDGVDTFDGKGPDTAKKTIQAAVTAAGSNNVIYVRDKGYWTSSQWGKSDTGFYHEQVTVPYATQNMSIIGVTPHLYDVYFGPTIRWGDAADHTGYLLQVYGPGISVYNMAFQNGYGDVTRGACKNVFLEGDAAGDGYGVKAGSIGATFYNCLFRDGDFALWGGYNCSVINSCFESEGTRDTASWTNLANNLPSGGHKLIGCSFMSLYGDNQATAQVYTAAGAHKNMLIKDCYFELLPADSHYMHFGATNTGLVTGCYFNSADISCGTADDTDEIYQGTDGSPAVVGCYDCSGTLIAG